MIITASFNITYYKLLYACGHDNKKNKKEGFTL